MSRFGRCSYYIGDRERKFPVTLFKLVVFSFFSAAFLFNPDKKPLISHHAIDTSNEQCLFYNLAKRFAYQLYKNDKDHCFVILPESTFPYNLKSWKEKLNVWCDCHENVDIILGAHQMIGEKTYNCAYHIHNGVIAQTYCKEHLVPFMEHIPLLFTYFMIGETFTRKDRTFSYPERNNNDIFLINGKKYQLFICSELYQLTKPFKSDATPMFIANNSWFMMNYAKRLAELFALYVLPYDAIISIKE